MQEFVGVIGSSVSVGWCEVVWNGYCLMNYLVKKCEARDCPACVERLPPQVGKHGGNAAVGCGGVGVVVEGEASCSSLDFFKFVYVRFCVGVPGWDCIF